MYQSNYIECPSCHKVFFNVSYKMFAVNEPAPCCGAFGEARGIWPGFSADKFLEIVHDQDLRSAQGQRIAIVFLHATLELLIEQSLWELLNGLHQQSNVASEALLDCHQGWERRVELYKKLRGRSLHQVLSDNGHDAFYQNSRILKKARNQIVHGSYYHKASEDNELIEQMRNNCIRAFACIHNDLYKELKIKAAEK